MSDSEPRDLTDTLAQQAPINWPKMRAEWEILATAAGLREDSPEYRYSRSRSYGFRVVKLTPDEQRRARR